MIGDIYKATSKTSGKSYIGQANKHIGRFHKKWGYLKRWKSHVKEAYSSAKDHCCLLNNAIRKYGNDDFNIELVCECITREEMNLKEIFYIQHFNSLAP